VPTFGAAAEILSLAELLAGSVGSVPAAGAVSWAVSDHPLGFTCGSGAGAGGPDAAISIGSRWNAMVSPARSRRRKSQDDHQQITSIRRQVPRIKHGGTNRL